MIIQIGHRSKDLAEIWYRGLILDANSKSEAMFSIRGYHVYKWAILVIFTNFHFVFLNLPFVCQKVSALLKLNRPRLAIVHCYIVIALRLLSIGQYSICLRQIIVKCNP